MEALLFSFSRSLLIFGLMSLTSGCSKKTQDAVVVAKEHIAAHIPGTEYKEREMDHEQWLVEVQLESGRKTNAPVDEVQWNALKVGDRVQANYSQADYTGTIWGIDIRKK